MSSAALPRSAPRLLLARSSRVILNGSGGSYPAASLLAPTLVRVGRWSTSGPQILNLGLKARCATTRSNIRNSSRGRPGDRSPGNSGRDRYLTTRSEVLPRPPALGPSSLLTTSDVTYGTDRSRFRHAGQFFRPGGVSTGREGAGQSF